MCSYYFSYLRILQTSPALLHLRHQKTPTKTQKQEWALIPNNPTQGGRHCWFKSHAPSWTRELRVSGTLWQAINEGSEDLWHYRITTCVKTASHKCDFNMDYLRCGNVHGLVSTCAASYVSLKCLWEIRSVWGLGHKFSQETSFAFTVSSIASCTKIITPTSHPGELQQYKFRSNGFSGQYWHFDYMSAAS